MTLDECAEFVDCEARKHSPESLYSLGLVEFERRHAVPLAMEVNGSGVRSAEHRVATLFRYSGEKRNY